MTVSTYALGRLRPGASRGGDCAATDLDQDRDVYAPGHRFVSTTHCRIDNGMLRLSGGPSGVAPTLLVEAWRGRVVVGDTYEDVYSDTYDGEIGTPAWFAMGTVTIDSPDVDAELTGVRLVRWNSEAVTIRLVAPAMADAYVTLRRGERQCRIQHGNTRSPRVDTDRRIGWTAAPAPGQGYASAGRVTELSPVIDGLARFVASIDPVITDAAAFSLTAASVNVGRFTAGVGTYARDDRAIDYHRQAGDASRPMMVVT